MGLTDKQKQAPDSDEARAMECMQNAAELRKQGKYRAAYQKMSEAAYYLEQCWGRDNPRLEQIRSQEFSMMIEALQHGQ